MNVIKCENPVILLNTEFQKHVVLSKVYHTPAGFVNLSNVQAYGWSLDFPTYLFKFHKKSDKKAFLAKMDDYYTITSVGEVIPMYIQVPCGRCILCRDRKSREFQFRTEVEAANSSTESLFLTLTYDNDHLPITGLRKKDVQNFFKRLRINLDNDGIEHNIRYLCVGEYGKNTHRPHYHIQLFNFPRYSVKLRTLPQVNDYIKNAWQAGFIYLVPATKGCTNYITKYMLKKSFVPDGCEPLFMTASRKNGGIGSSFFKQNKEFYRNNPHEYRCVINNKGNIFSSTLSQYGKRIIYPSLSQFIPAVIRQCYHDFRVTLHQLVSISSLLFDDKYKCTKYVDVIKKYRPLGFRFVNTNMVFNYMEYARANFGQLCDAISYYEKRLDYLATVLREYKFDVSLYEEIYKFKQKRTEYATLIVSELTEDDVKYLASELRKKVQENEHHEIL